MEKLITALKKYTPGVALAALLAVVARFVADVLPGGIIGGSVVALVFGMALNPLVAKYKFFGSGVSFSSSRVLKFSIVLMGASLSLSQVLQVGGYSIVVMCFTLFTAFFGGWALGRALGIDWKLYSLLSVGTAVCGGSAIAAVSPVIEAEDGDIAFAISITFLFDILLIVLFPLMGRAFGMTDLGFGLWAGTAINDTSSVVAASYAFSDAAGNYAVIVKLTRTLSIIPIVMAYSMIARRKQALAAGTEATGDAAKASLRKSIPWFVLFFLGMVILRSVNLITADLGSQLSSFSKFLMVMALGAVGLKTSFKSFAKIGLKPVIHKVLVATAVVVVAFLVQSVMGQL